MSTCPNDGSFSAFPLGGTMEKLFGRRKNPSPLGTLPFFKQGLNFLPMNSTQQSSGYLSQSPLLYAPGYGIPAAYFHTPRGLGSGPLQYREYCGGLVGGVPRCEALHRGKSEGLGHAAHRGCTRRPPPDLIQANGTVLVYIPILQKYCETYNSFSEKNPFCEV